MTGKPQARTRSLALGVLVTASLALAACGGQGSAVTPHPTPTATIPAKWRGISQTPLPEPTPPYTFPASWQSAQGLAAYVSGFAFASSAPLIGYACTAQTPAETAGAPGDDACYGSVDGGQSWTPLPSVPVQDGQFLSITVDQSDPRDVFLTGRAPWQSNAGQFTYVLWRSRDAGASWARLGQPNTGYPLMLEDVAVVGARIVVSVNVAGEGLLPNNLFASDDSGATWKPFGINVGGQGVNAQSMVALGSTLLVAAQLVGTPAAMSLRVPSAPARQEAPASACGPAPAGTPTPASWHPGIACGDSSGTPAPITYWRTADGGRSWAQVHVPGGMPVFARATTGSGYFGFTLAFGQDGPTVVYWTHDAGATWIALPTLQGLEGNYVDASTVGPNGEATVGPDGTVFVGTWGRPQGLNVDGPAGIFTIRPADPAPHWQPLAPTIEALPAGWQATPGPDGTRLWAAAGTLMYVDVP